jgi:hypothetical protein
MALGLLRLLLLEDAGQDQEFEPPAPAGHERQDPLAGPPAHPSTWGNRGAGAEAVTAGNGSWRLFPDRLKYGLLSPLRPRHKAKWPYIGCIATLLTRRVPSHRCTFTSGPQV